MPLRRSVLLAVKLVRLHCPTSKLSQKKLLLRRVPESIRVLLRFDIGLYTKIHYLSFVVFDGFGVLDFLNPPPSIRQPLTGFQYCTAHSHFSCHIQVDVYTDSISLLVSAGYLWEVLIRLISSTPAATIAAHPSLFRCYHCWFSKASH